jgi:hypothetical protein
VIALCLGNLTNFLKKVERFLELEIVESSGPLMRRSARR